MNPSLLRLCAALAPIISWTLVAPASQEPSAQRMPRIETVVPSVLTAESAIPATATAVDSSYLASTAPASPDEETPNPIVHPWRRLLKREVTKAVVVQANAIIRTHSVVGDEVAFTVDGERFLARIEEHYHPPGGDKLPWGPHPGVSVFVARPPATGR